MTVCYGTVQSRDTLPAVTDEMLRKEWITHFHSLYVQLEKY